MREAPVYDRFLERRRIRWRLHCRRQKLLPHQRRRRYRTLRLHSLLRFQLREKTLLEAYRSPLFMGYHDNQPFNGNMLRPCPVLDNLIFSEITYFDLAGIVPSPEEGGSISLEEASDSRAESGASCDQPDRRHILFEHGILRFEAQLFRAAFPQAPGIGSSAVFAVLHDGHRAHCFPGAAHERVCLCRRYLHRHLRRGEFRLCAVPGRTGQTALHRAIGRGNNMKTDFTQSF